VAAPSGTFRGAIATGCQGDSMDYAYLIKFLGALFAIMNPFMTLPMFLSLTDGLEESKQRRIALSTLGYCTIMCVTVAVAGTHLLTFFGISVDDFRVAGGLVLMVIGFGMLNGTGSRAHHGTSAEQEHQAQVTSIAFYPITFPMIVGPGTITTLVLFMAQAKGPMDYVAFAMVVALVLALLGIVLYLAGFIGHFLSQTLRVILSRVMGLILIAISVEMAATGLKAVLPGLG
jgi:multiple antibiotic resistance protein